MVEFHGCRLRDICASIDYGLTASASPIARGPRFLRITDIVGPDLNWNEVPFVGDGAGNLDRYRLNHGDIVIARTGATTGESRFIQDPPDAVFASYLVRLTVKAPNCPRYVAYWLKSPAFRHYLQGVLGDKSAQPNASASTMANALMRLPKEGNYQSAIASILGALDDKIDLNRRMNETLEAMARAIFHDWFVAFGPTRAKLEGRPPYLAPDLWSLFPDRLDDDGKPEGWTASTIGEEVTVVGGTTPSTKEPGYWNGLHHWATPKDLSNLADPVLLDTDRRITAEGLAQIGSGLLSTGSVLLSSRAPIGYLAINQVPTAINQGFIGMTCAGRLSNLFAWLWTKANMEVILQKANGSTFQEISKSNFRPIPVVVPRTAILAAFETAVRPLWDRLCANVSETRTLSATRDLLLPRLMSGELRVNDAERVIEAAA